MQVQVENFALFANVISQSKNVYILVGSSSNEDLLCAALFLEENLANLGKKVLIVASGRLPESLRLFEAKISKEVPPKKLIVSFNWKQNEVEKVAYNLEGDSFNFVITPRGKEINPSEVRIFPVGDEPDLIITLGIKSLSEISEIKSDILESKTIINIDKNEANEGFANLNFIYPHSDSVSAITASLFEKSGLPVKPVSVSIIMQGIKVATENFQRVKDPATFESAAFCTRLLEKPQEKTPTQVVDQKDETENLFKAKQLTN